MLGEAFDSLHPHLRRAHEAPLVVEGTAHVRSASNFVGAVIAYVMRFPRPGHAVPVRLEVSETQGGTMWLRKFGSRRVRTYQRNVDGCMVEHRGPGRLFFRVTADDHGVTYESVRFDLFRIPVPRALAPRTSGRVTPRPDGWQTEIDVSLPLVGRLTGYTAMMKLA